MPIYMLFVLTYPQNVLKKVKKFNISEVSLASTFSFNVYKVRIFFDIYTYAQT
jgi:hypothetical protein